MKFFESSFEVGSEGERGRESTNLWDRERRKEEGGRSKKPEGGGEGCKRTKLKNVKKTKEKTKKKKKIFPKQNNSSFVFSCSFTIACGGKRLGALEENLNSDLGLVLMVFEFLFGFCCFVSSYFLHFCKTGNGVHQGPTARTRVG